MFVVLYGFVFWFSSVEGVRVLSFLLRPLAGWALLELCLLALIGLADLLYSACCVLPIGRSSFPALLALLELELSGLLELVLLELVGLLSPVCCVLPVGRSPFLALLALLELELSGLFELGLLGLGGLLSPVCCAFLE